ncbi:MAG: alpha amylase C-terminal domain-containing protein, partial [Hoeflea sp.]|nr:alpha amylase C-terminal domain-containing protein [Hoeflea sp.]
KKLLFMGQEFAQRGEWSEARQLDWDHLDDPRHSGMQDLVRDLNRLYARTPALHARDCEPEGFEWLVADDSLNSVYAWVRRAPGEKPVVIVANLTPAFRTAYTLPMPQDGIWREIFNSDATIYGGSGKGNLGEVTARLEGGRVVAELTLPPLATLMFTPDRTGAW